MQLLNLAGLAGHAVDAHRSRGFTLAHLSAAARVSYARLTGDGVIGAHPADGDQLLVVLSGTVTVEGAEAAPAVLAPGQAALWQRGENHRTQALIDSELLLVEGYDVGQRIVLG